MSFIKTLFQEAIIFTFRPLIFREVEGWGKIYNIFVGSYKRNWFWQNTRKRRIKGKLNNFWMELDISQWSDRYTFFLGRWYDLPTQKLLEQVLKKGDEVIDVGANIGMFALAARHIIGTEGIVYSFEPNPEARKHLNYNIEINQIENIKVYPVGLGETDAQLTLYVPYINSGEGSLASFPNTQYKDNKCYEVKVDVKVGDTLLQETAPRLIKIDVEGGEVGVLKGISKLIDRHRPLIIAEYVPKHIRRFGNSFEDILLIAQEHSYNLFKLDLLKISGSYNLSLIPIEDSKFDEPCDILLGHAEDPFIKALVSGGITTQ
ncbi:hypothetical protein PL8927_690046 [Planktothrix serta PCC 8927]|uniref:Methyltransferase FkbM domain-containing protein n=1 Tax=Planktothrix serta PCC 8927 TaxID=671068 RepID=A0A7Z9BQA5_9CYAN|nr:FkbM family methyltransferase [Planktothrix serta]VXD20292.1 hypothetical protein PL8927_690046 [Planktothrix serta PCC 8927]